MLKLSFLKTKTTMKNFEINITIEAEDEEQASEKIEAFALFNETLSHDEFVSLAELVEEKPQAVTLIRKIGKEFEKKEINLVSVLSMIKNNWSDIKSIIK